MQKLRLIVLVIAAICGVFLMTQSEAINVSQLDALKNQFLPAEYRNTNFTLGKLEFESLKRD